MHLHIFKKLRVELVNLSNNATRIIVSVFTIPIIIAVTYYGKIYFFIFILFLSLVSFFEFSSLADKKLMKPNLIIGYAAILLILVNQYFVFVEYFQFFTVLMIFLLIIELFRNNGSAIMNLGATLLGIMYIGLFGSSLLSLREMYPDIGNLYSRGGYLIISILASIWICDSAAYFGGTALGRHKLFLRVSPKKSWEGAVIGFIFAVITIIAAKFLVLEFMNWTTVICIGLIVGIFGQLGDLVESLLKRDAGVKDSSALIPGHGGIFDRFDSLLMTSPVVYVFLKFFG